MIRANNLAPVITFSILFLVAMKNATATDMQEPDTGTVEEILISPEGFRNGLLMRLEKTERLAVIKFPPPLWPERARIGKGDTLEFRGNVILTEPNLVVDRVEIKTGPTILLDDTKGLQAGDPRVMPTPLKPEGGQIVNREIVQGVVKAVSANPERKIDRIIFQDGSIANVGPAVAGPDFKPQIGRKMSVSGVGGVYDGKLVLDVKSYQMNSFAE